MFPFGTKKGHHHPNPQQVQPEKSETTISGHHDNHAATSASVAEPSSPASSPPFPPTTSTTTPASPATQQPSAFHNRPGDTPGPSSAASPSSFSPQHDLHRLQNHYNPRRSIERGPPRAPDLSEPSQILTNTTALTPLMLSVPARYRESDLRLAYSTLRDGASLRAFFDKCNLCTSPVFLAVRDKGNAVFGAFITEPKWNFKPKHHGSGESFCFTLQPKLAIFTWSHKNKYFQRATPNSISIGGGRAFALHLGDMFERGTSGPCDTYDSPTLSSSEQFEVTVLEAWELVSRHS